MSIGPAKAQETLRTALAMGADRAILVQTDEGSSRSLVAKIFAKIAAEEQPQLMILGKQAIDDDNNATGQMLAALLGWPQGTFASKIEVPDNATVTREVDGGLETVKLNLPAVVTTDLRLNEPRYASLPNIMKAKSKPLATKSPGDYGVDVARRLETLKVVEPSRRQAGIKVGRVDELVEKAQGPGDCEMTLLWFWSSMTAAASRMRRWRRSPRRPNWARSTRSLGNSVDSVAQAAAKIAGVVEGLSASSPALEHQLAEAAAPVAARLMESHDAFLAPATTTGKNIAPRVAALLDVMQITDILSVEGAGHLHPPDLRRQRDRDGQVEGREEGDHGAHHGVREGGGGRRFRASGAGRCRQRQWRQQLRLARRVESERPELTSAKVIVSGGRAFGSSEQFHALLDPLADKLGAAVGASARRSMRAMRPTTIRSARPARSSLRKSMSRSAFPAPSSTSPE